MKIVEAMAYAKEHASSLKKDNKTLIAFNYAPKSKSGHFEIYSLSYEIEVDGEAEYRGWALLVDSSDIPDGGHGCEGSGYGESLEELVADQELKLTNELIHSLIFKVGGNWAGMSADHALSHEMDIDLERHWPNCEAMRSEAVQLIDKWNSNK